VLVIKRRVGELIRIGDQIEITVLEITPTKVLLGVNAPSEMRVARDEVRLVQDENAAASRLPRRVETAILNRIKTASASATAIVPWKDSSRRGGGAR
jgi:carbon storage regulator